MLLNTLLRITLLKSVLNRGTDVYFFRLKIMDRVLPKNISRVCLNGISRFRASKSKGTGLGLAISKDFIEAQSGRIWVESEIGGGAKFCFELPV